MDKTLNRRAFLRTSFLGVGTFIVTLSPLKMFANQPTNANKNKFTPFDSAQLYKEAREHFYKKEYGLAESKFLQLIEDLPQNIQYYDGYARVLGAQQRMLETAELYRLALNKHNKNPYLMHRLAVSLKKISRANNKAELIFIEKYGVNNLLSYSAELLLAAIAIKPVKGFMLELRDIPTALIPKNELRTNKGLAPIALPLYLSEKIEPVTDIVKQRWNETRTSRKPHLIADADAGIKKLKDKKRRELYNTTEREMRENAIKKARKVYLEQALAKSILDNKPTAVDKFGLLILTENITDTETVGKMRRFYRKNKHPERLITLNRFLYSRNNSIHNALSLASCLIKHSKQKKVTVETKQLLDLVAPLIDTLPPVCLGDYYISLAQIDIVNGKQAEARKNLLTGIAKLDGKGGVAYTLLEKYAATFTGVNRLVASEILKALCQKGYKKNNDAVWEFVRKHIEYQKEKPLNNQEKLKYLIALSKIQKAISSPEYNTTLQEIQELKT